MSTAACPLCNKRYSQGFLALHAASCSLPAKAAITKSPRSKQPTTLPLGPRYATRPSRSAPPSECGAPGFHLLLNVFTAAEERALLSSIEREPPAWGNYMFRLTKGYGPAYDLPARRFLFGPGAPKEIPLPPYATDIVLPRVRAAMPLLTKFRPNQLAVGLYRVPGPSHILPHNDCENGIIGTAVVGVCLGAACTMTLILRSRDSGLGRDVKNDVRLPPRAVYVMSGDSLRVWEHAIFPGKTEATRYSLTFRDVGPFVGEDESGASRARKAAGNKKRRLKQSHLS